MTEARSSLYSLLTGLAGGAAAWTGVEIILRQTAAFPDLRILTLSLGAAAGLLLGAIVPLAEGLRQNQPGKLGSAVVTGSLIGLIFGALGMAAGQLIMASLADAPWMRSPSPARIPGWIILGTAVGSASGLRSGSLRRISGGALGGFIGGTIGGFAAEFLSSLIDGFYGRAEDELLEAVRLNPGEKYRGLPYLCLAELYDTPENEGRDREKAAHNYEMCLAMEPLGGHAPRVMKRLRELKPHSAVLALFR